MKNTLPFILTIGLLFSFTALSFAQRSAKKYIKNEERFNAGVVIGINTTQIDGDMFTGYDKNGLTGGIKGIVRITPRLDFNMELLYSKKGSKIISSIPLGGPPIKDKIIDLTYMDVPLVFKWLLEDRAHTWHIETGIIYSGLIDQKITETINDPKREFSYNTIVDDFSKSEISWVGGLGYTLKGGFALHGRFIYGLSPFYDNETYEPPNPRSLEVRDIEFLRNYFISLQLSYAIFKY